MRYKCLAYFLLGTFLCIHAKSKSPKTSKYEKITNEVDAARYNKSGVQIDAGTKRTWDCHRGCLRFCLPSCKKSCCQPGAKDFSPTMIKEIEEFQGELKGGLDQRNAINEGREVVEPFACGQFCSPECSPECTIACCTETLPKDGKSKKTDTSPLSPLARVSGLFQKDPQRLIEMPCGEYCSALCKPSCTSECCNARGRREKSNYSKISKLNEESVKKPVQKQLMFTSVGTCHADCEKLCLPACEFVCCVPTKMRSSPFGKDIASRFGQHKKVT